MSAFIDLLSGKFVNDIARQGLHELLTRFSSYHHEFEKRPETLEDLTAVLNMIVLVQSSSDEIELKFHDLLEIYRTMSLHNVVVDELEIKNANSLPEKWADVVTAANKANAELTNTKKKFAASTQVQVSEFQKMIAEYKNRFVNEGPGFTIADLDEGLEAMLHTTQELKTFRERREYLVRAEKLFDLPLTPCPDFYEVDSMAKDIEKIFDLYSEFRSVINGYANMLWSNLDVSNMNKSVEGLLTRLKKLPKDFKKFPVFHAVSEKIIGFRDSIPLYAGLKTDALRERHWKRLLEVTGKRFDVSPETLTLEKVFSMNLNNHIDAVNDIVSGASKELSIENGLKEIESNWRNTRFTVAKYMKGTEERGYVLGAIDEIQTALDDNVLNLQSMSASKFIAAFLPTVQKWEKLLSLVSETLDVWMLVQRKWMYLESIFVAGDIRQQLPEEAQKFDQIDKSFKRIMTDTAKQPVVLEACSTEGRLETLRSLADDLEACQKSLSDYLETKRNAFPRFFFLSDEELLSILGSQDPTNIQEHIIKMFDNVAKLAFGSGRTDRTVVGMVSTENEVLQFRTPVSTDGRVEDWMGAVQSEMKSTNHFRHKEAIWNYVDMDRMNWYDAHMGMTTLAASQVWWTWEVENSFQKIRNGDKLAMKVLSRNLGSQLEHLVITVRSDLSSIARKKMNTQIIIDVHARDIVDRFVRDSVMDSEDFAWESQLRFYWDRKTDHLVVRQCTGQFEYGYEYMGLNGRLVITPLTDRYVVA